MKEFPGFKVIKTEHDGNPLYLYLTGNSCLVDTGVGNTPEKVIFPFMHEQNIEPTKLSIVYVTHFHGDHCWGLGAIKRKAPAVTIIAHERDVEWIEDAEKGIRGIFDPYSPWLPDVEDEILRQLRLTGPKVRVNLVLKGKEKLVLDSGQELEVLHTPGHSAGHSILYDSTSGCAYIGDAVLGRGQGVGETVSFPYYEDVNAYIQSIQTIRDLQPLRYLCTCHFGVLEGDEIMSFINSSEEFVRQVDSVIRQVLAGSSQPMSLWDVADSVRKRLGSYAMSVVTLATVNAHLEYLRQAGVVETVTSTAGRLWKLTD